nr:hypothetical protein [uncultured Mediterranean phage uvMED]
MDKNKKEISFDEMTDKQIANSLGLELSEFDEGGDMMEELREILEE